MLTLADIVEELDLILDPDDDMGFISASEVGMLRDQIDEMMQQGFRIVSRAPRRRRSARTQTPSDRRRPSKQQRKPSAYQTWAAKERKKIAKQHPRFDFGRTQQELSKRWKAHKRKKGMK